MVKIRISYEDTYERDQIMRRLEPVLRNAKVKENLNSEKFNHLYITYQPVKTE